MLIIVEKKPQPINTVEEVIIPHLAEEHAIHHPTTSRTTGLSKDGIALLNELFPNGWE